MKLEDVLSEVSPLVSEQMNENLKALATEEEVRKLLFMMHPKKVPGPDGLTALFFQNAWQVIKKDLVELVNGFLRTSFLTNG